MEFPYKKNQIYECIQEHIERYVTESYLKESALTSLTYKVDEFIFSKITYAHLCVWGKQEKIEDKIKIMASVELFVLACDILDDLQDMDAINEPWMQIESKYAMDLVYLLLSLPELMIQSTSFSMEKKLSLLEIYAMSKIKSVNGQNQSLQRKVMNEEEYISMIEKKSGSFMAFACLLGSIHASKEDQAIIEKYGVHIGCFAQIENDLLGISESQYYKDILTKEISLPIIYMLHFEKNHFPPLYHYYESEEKNYQWMEKSSEFKEYIHHSGAIPYSRTMQMIQFQKGMALIDSFYQLREDRGMIKNAFLNPKKQTND